MADKIEFNLYNPQNVYFIHLPYFAIENLLFVKNTLIFEDFQDPIVTVMCCENPSLQTQRPIKKDIHGEKSKIK